MKPKLTLAALLLWPLFFVSCNDTDLQKVAKGLDITAKSIGVLQTTVITANQQGLVGDDETRTILEVCQEVNQAGKDATMICKGLAQLQQPDRQKLLTVLVPVIKAVSDAILRCQYIKDPATRQKIQGIVLTIQSALNAIQIAVAGG